MRSGYCEGLNRDQIVKIARLTGCKNFVGKRKKFIFNAFVDLLVENREIFIPNLYLAHPQGVTPS